MLRRDENGAVILMTLGMFLFIYMLCIAIYAVGTSVHERIRLQNIADAAAYSASVAQADGLSRLATINRAISWTYIQLTRQQMDYIVHKWLKKTVTNFQEDLTKIQEWNKKKCSIPSAKYESSRSWYIYIPNSCGTHQAGTEDTSNSLGTCWIGWTPGDGHQIRLGYATEDEAVNMGSAQPEQFGFLASKETLAGMLLDNSGESQLKDNIDKSKNMLTMLNALGFATCTLMHDGMERCAKQVLTNSISKDELGDYRYKLNLMMMSYPYETSLISNLSPYRNTEEDELELLSMTMATPHLHDIFGDGIDQWFVRGHAGILNDTGEVVQPDSENYTGDGIQRGYKTANRVEGTMEGPKGDVLRGNHVAAASNFLELVPVVLQNLMSIVTCQELWVPLVAAGGLDLINQFRILISSFSTIKGDINPSCFNSKRFFAEQCDETKNNFGLVSEYHWGAMRWWCATEIHFRRIWKIIYISSIKKKHYKLLPKDECNVHGYGNYSKGFDSHSRSDYKPCVMGLDDVSGIMASTHDSANKVKGYVTAGHARIYGDDKDIYDDAYIGAKAMPVKLNEKFFRSANFVALAKKRRNPLSLATSEDEWLDTGNLIDSSLYALFNMLRKKGSDGTSAGEDPRWICAVSASRAACRERSIDNDGYLPGRVYQTKNSVLTSGQVDHSASSNGAPIHLHVSAGGGNVTTNMTKWPYRFGCPHHNANNQIAKRLKKIWNLCETDWDAVFVPLKFSMGEYTADYDGLADSKNIPYRRRDEVGQGEIGYFINTMKEGWLTFKSDETETLDMDILGMKPSDQSFQSFDVSKCLQYIKNNIYRK